MQLWLMKTRLPTHLVGRECDAACDFVPGRGGNVRPNLLEGQWRHDDAMPAHLRFPYLGHLYMTS
jgi:hypothetical protein